MSDPYTATVGQAASVTDANGHKTRRESDLSGRLRNVIEYTAATDPYAVYATTTYAYDGRDLLRTVTDQAGNVTTIGYDSLGRKVSMADPDMGAWSYAYDPNGTLHTQTDARGQAITFAYDALDRLTGKTYSTGYPTAYYRYDEADVTDGRGQRTTTMNANTGTRYAYDERGRQTSTTATVAGLSESRVFEWTYDSADRVQTMTYPALPGNAAREQVTYTYDAAWRQIGLGGLATYAQNATYTALDQPLTTPLGNGTTQAWTYDPVMQRLQASTVGNGALDRSYTYDNVGNVTTIADNLVAQTQTFDYDARDRLTHAATSGGTVGTYDESYTYDPIGNLTSKGATASPVAYAYPTGGQGVARPHAPTTIGGRAQTYDANGNLTGDPGRLALTWSAENQPLSIASTNAQAAPQSWGDQNCDGAGTRTSPGALGGFGGVTAFARGNDQVLAVTAGGTVLACGQNSQGQLGDGTTTARTAPVTVAGLSGVTAVAAGEQYSLALKADGTVWSWGYNGDGRLGDGTTSQRLTPVQVSGLTGVVAIAAGRDFGLAVKSDGTVMAWGNNNGNHLGDGTTTHRYTPVQVSGLTGVTAVAAGYGHSVARKNDGTAWAWGDNSAGQLGAGSSASGATPVQVSGLTGVTGVAAGDTHGLAVKSDGTVWAWGENSSGQLGDGTSNRAYTPVQTSGLTTATAVAAGAYHSLALLADGTVRAWGGNNSGQLGDGTTTGRNTPVAVGGLQGVDRIAARANGSIARPTQTSEQYTYDADGMRVTRSTGGAIWLYLGGGLWEERLGGNTSGPGGWIVRTFYTLQGRTIAQQENTPSSYYSQQGRLFLLGDHLGSVGVVTDANSGQVVSRQDYTPWGEARGGDITQTTLDFTGQRRDGTGLLYYGARYYDPTRGQFLSPDSVVPGMASGKGGAAATLGQDDSAALRPLTVDFHESAFAATLAREDAFTQAKGFWFQLNKQDRRQALPSSGPRNAQALNRYSYVLDNPLRYTDPHGHCPMCSGEPEEPGSGPESDPQDDSASDPTGDADPSIDDSTPDPADSPIDPDNRQGAQLTEAELTMFGRIDDEPQWILEHPDLEDESYGANHETQFAPDSPEYKKMYRHVGEARQEINKLNRAITHLQRVRGTKTAAAQVTIDQYIAEAERYKQILQSILDTR